MANKICGLGIDIGTTTIEAVLTDSDGNVTADGARRNSGAALGADVIHRIEAASSGRAGELRSMLRDDITAVIRSLTAADPDNCEYRTVIAGNTAMLHILCGYDCSGLGTNPYTAVTLSAEERLCGELLPDVPAAMRDSRVFLMPGISAFVGADITSGLFSVHAMEIPRDSSTLFMDIGTNGEMALIRNIDGNVSIKVCSTAAGPVFEGAGVRCGMRGEPGAICEVYLTPGRPVSARYRTIGGLPPRGICGSGVLEAVSELVRLKLADSSGLLSEPWFSSGFPLTAPDEEADIRLFSDDIRAVQLAKAAICAGAQVLPSACGTRADMIDDVIVAGAFGRALPFSRLAPLGMIPRPLLKKCRAAGNTSLSGTERYLSYWIKGNEKEAMAELDAITSCASELPLAGRRDFEACYVAAIDFKTDGVLSGPAAGQNP